ncbi:MAG: putative quinol monooxygenase [Terracoccus sp.]
MTDLRVVAEIIAKDGSEDAIRSALSTLVTATLEEEGCVAYELFESNAKPGTFFTIETWRSQADLDAHMTSEHIATAFAAAGDHVASAPSIHPLSPVN